MTGPKKSRTKITTSVDFFEKDGFGGIRKIKVKAGQSYINICITHGNDLVPFKMEALATSFGISNGDDYLYKGSKVEVEKVLESKILSNFEKESELEKLRIDLNKSTYPISLTTETKHFSIHLKLYEKADLAILIVLINIMFENCVIARLIFYKYILLAADNGLTLEEFVKKEILELESEIEQVPTIYDLVLSTYEAVFEMNEFSNPFESIDDEDYYFEDVSEGGSGKVVPFAPKSTV